MISSELVKDYLIKINQLVDSVGDHVDIGGASSLKKPKSNTLTWSNQKEIKIKKNNLIIIVPTNTKRTNTNYNHHVFFVEDPRYSFFKVIDHFFINSIKQQGIHSTSIDHSVDIPQSCYIGHNVVIKAGCTIGKHTIIQDNVVLTGRVSLGNNVKIGSFTSIGDSGFGFYKSPQGIWQQVPHLGGIKIGNHVEIGSNCAIARGVLDDTVINNGVKINTFCHIGHNTVIEDNTIICSKSCISGSVHIKSNSYIGPGCTIRNGVTIGTNTVIGLGSHVLENIVSNSIAYGCPAKRIRNNDIIGLP